MNRINTKFSSRVTGQIVNQAREKQKFRRGKCWFSSCPPYRQDKDRLKKDHSRLVGGSLIQQKLHTRLVLGDHKMSRSPHPASRIFKAYVEALTGFRPDHLSNILLSQSYNLETAASIGIRGRKYIPRTGDGVRCLLLPGSSLRVNRWSCPLDGLPQQKIIPSLSYWILYAFGIRTHVERQSGKEDKTMDQ